MLSDQKIKTFQKIFRQVWVVSGCLLLGSLVVWGLAYGGFVLRRPARSPVVRSLFQGVEYARYARRSPRPMVFHVIAIDLTAPGIGFLVTPQGIDPEGKETIADTVPGFLQKHGVQVAINTNFFYPMYVNHLLDYAPRVGEGVNVVGLAISNGDRYSPVEPGWPALCIVSPREITISEGGDCPANTDQAMTGDRYFLKNAQMVTAADSSELFPRTVVALNKARDTLWLVTVDGRQEGYSEGIALSELAKELVALGADEALNLDGGGSSTLAVERFNRAKVLNSPIQARVPTYLRPVATHLGVYANDLPQ